MRITTKGQVTIPIEIRERLGLLPNTEVEFEVDRDDVVLWSGHGFHIVHYPLRGGTLFNIVTVFKTSSDAAPSDTSSPHPDLDRVYRDSHPTMKALWAMMDLSRRGWARRPMSPRCASRWRSRTTAVGYLRPAVTTAGLSVSTTSPPASSSSKSRLQCTSISSR